jgi:hypothetical protein
MGSAKYTSESRSQSMYMFRTCTKHDSFLCGQAGMVALGIAVVDSARAATHLDEVT